MRIGVFDSGVGGLSIMAAIHRVLPDADLAYCCDNLNFPYGTKTDEQVLACATNVAVKFAHAARIDVLVIACNTASTIALPALRQNLMIPVVGVVPAVKPAAHASKSKIIGILATPATVRRPYLDDLIREFANDCEVVRVGSSRLVEFAERKLRGDIAPEAEFRQEVAEIIDAAARGLDHLVLGCTHFPLLADELRCVIPPAVQFIDSGAAVAVRVAAIGADMLKNPGEPLGINPTVLDGFCSGDPMTLQIAKLGIHGNLTLVLRALV